MSEKYIVTIQTNSLEEAQKLRDKLYRGGKLTINEKSNLGFQKGEQV